jgi:hypothetical protein
MQRSSRPRKTANLSDSVHHKLNLYALAASCNGSRNAGLGTICRRKDCLHPGTYQAHAEPQISFLTSTTLANKPIIAGKTQGPDDTSAEESSATPMPASEPATLGALAMGAPGLLIWRREESVGATQ